MTYTTSHTAQPLPDRETLLHRIILRIRQSLELQEILETTVVEVRAYLGSDRVKIYRFDTDGSGEVIAEARNGDHLPSLLGLNFPADDIPPYARELFIKARQRVVVDVVSHLTTGLSPIDALESDQTFSEKEMRYRPVDPCHVEYLNAMQVKSSVVVPILHQTHLWGLLVSHHSEQRTVSEEELQFIGSVADQVEVAIAQSTLLQKVRQQAEQESKINRVSMLLHTIPTVQLQAALEEAIQVFQGSGGRLYLMATEGDTADILYTYGEQPSPLVGSLDRAIEQHLMWQQYLRSPGSAICHIEATQDSGIEPWSSQFMQSAYTRQGERPDPSYWAINDIYQEPLLRTLIGSFHATQIRGVMIVPLRYAGQPLGCLTIFRQEVETARTWAGRRDVDPRQLMPQMSFEAWRELKNGQATPWTEEESKLAQVLGNHFSMAAQQYGMYRQVQSLNANLECQVQTRTSELQQLVEQQQALTRVVVNIRESLDLDLIFQTTTQEVGQLLGADRVAIYRFNPDWSGEYVYEFVTPGWLPLVGGTNTVWKDTHLQETQGGRYRHNQTVAVDDIYQAGYSACHIEMLERFQVRACAIAPIFVGQTLWGLLAAYQHSAPRSWCPSEVNLLAQVGNQFSVAIQQAELLSQTQHQTEELQQSVEQQQATISVVARIRDSLDLDVIFQTTTSEVRQLLEADRVGIYQFNPDWSGEFVAESAAAGWVPLLNAQVSSPHLKQNLTAEEHCKTFDQAASPPADTYLQETQGGVYSRGSHFKQVDDIYKAGFSPCYLAVLEAYQCRAYVIVPIFEGASLWGLLATYQNSDPRQWSSSEVSLLVQMGVQLGVAIQHAELLSRTRQQTEQLGQTLDDLKKTQGQLIQTEKMSSLGQLVAGVAHEINNPVNFIYGNLSHVEDYAHELLELLKLYQRYPSPAAEVDDRIEDIDLDFITDDLPKMLSSMRVGADRIRQIVLSLRNFSRLDQAEVKPVDIHEGIDNTLLILQHRLKAVADHPEIEIVKEYGQLPLVECHAGQLNQVFMNILSNAIEALEEHDRQQSSQGIAGHPSRITIRTQLLDPLGDAPTGVVIRISDNGPGMTEQVRSRLFDPFFTTKPVGQGTGLGLAISYQIVTEKHGGELRCTSHPGQGTEFWIEIPMCSKPS